MRNLVSKKYRSWILTRVSTPFPKIYPTNIAIENGLKSRRSIVSEAGGDFEKTIEEIAQDNQLAESKGVALNSDRSVESEAE